MSPGLDDVRPPRMDRKRRAGAAGAPMAGRHG